MQGSPPFLKEKDGSLAGNPAFSLEKVGDPQRLYAAGLRWPRHSPDHNPDMFVGSRRNSEW